MIPSVPDDWFVGFHTGLVARFWRAAGETMTESDTELLRGALDLPEGARVLDAPCGDGRLTLALAAHGYETVGVDIAAAELERGRDRAARRGLPATFATGDLRELPALGQFDGVISWGNSFGYLTPADSAGSLAGMRQALRPGGRLVLESMTVAESLLANGVESGMAMTVGGVRMTATNRYDAQRSRLDSSYRFEDDSGHTETAVSAHHVHTTGELVRMLSAAGFATVELRGPGGERAFELGDPRVIAVADA